MVARGTDWAVGNTSIYYCSLHLNVSASWLREVFHVTAWQAFCYQTLKQKVPSWKGKKYWQCMNLRMRKKMEFHSDALWISILVYGIHGATFEELRLFLIYVPHFSDKQKGCLWSNKGYRACSAENHTGHHRELLSFLLSYGSCLVSEKLLDQRLHWAKNINILWYKSSPLTASYLDSTQSDLLYLSTVSLLWWK